MKKNNSFVNVALIYSATLIIVKMIGAVYKIFLGNVLTEAGASYYAFGYPYFNAMLAITTVGFPAAIAKVTSEYLAEDNILGAEQLFFVMKRFLLIIGVISTTILFLAAPFIAHFG
ncbi:MAG: stage V sporulation protein B, partial [Clostridiales bacterium]